MCIFLATKKYAVVFLLRWLAGVWLATCLADQRPVAPVWLTESEGSGPVGLAQLRLSAVDLSMWRGTASAHTVRLFLVQEVASVPTRVEFHLSKQPMVFAVQVHVKPRGLGTRVSSQPAAPQPGKAGRWRACHGALRICGRGRWTCEDRTWGHSDVSLVSL